MLDAASLVSESSRILGDGIAIFPLKLSINKGCPSPWIRAKAYMVLDNWERWLFNSITAAK